MEVANHGRYNMESTFRNKVICRIAPLDFQANGNWPSTSDWDSYFSRYYNDNTKFLSKGDDFMSYEDKGEEVYIQDCIADNTINALRLWTEINEIAGERPIKFCVHAVNWKLLQTAIRLGFDIESWDGKQFSLKRGGK